MTDACKTPMADHVAEFWRLLETEHVRILIDIRVEHDDSAVVHWDSSSFSNTVAKAIAADHRATKPEYLSGCLHPGNEPNSCQYEGKCLSLSCNHNGKTWHGPRMTLEAQDPNLLYPKVET